MYLIQLIVYSLWILLVIFHNWTLEILLSQELRQAAIAFGKISKYHACYFKIDP
jgi:hypothetical protein